MCTQDGEEPDPNGKPSPQTTGEHQDARRKKLARRWQVARRVAAVLLGVLQVSYYAASLSGCVHTSAPIAEAMRALMEVVGTADKWIDGL